ncbi:ABC transporter permease [Gimesia algae]|uniref:ABC-2 family transporter protein n=1 Tax=Gimesia algae TaxID=2527971 RepID=A0A517VIW0_9PLAN|nr:ABC transporter permease [Gimesia algae]QDT92944.1 ABC-2 family transporter protein [Gimesia algae]
MSFDPIPYDTFGAFIHFLSVFGSAMLLALIVCLIVGVITRGTKGVADVFLAIGDFFVQMIHLSCRRIWSLSVLTIRESLRQKILYVFIVFAVLFMFAGWFLSGTADRPDLQVQSYIDFVLKAISWLVIPIMLLLSCWSLPEDIRLRTIHTVVTKPVHRIEIVLGRMLGFTLLGTVILLVMGTVGYIWINRQVPDIVKYQPMPSAVEQLESEENSSDDKTEEEKKLELEDSLLVSKVPLYGEISFTDREGAPTKLGINVGDVWMHRSYIEGATKASAIYKFKGVDESDAIKGDLVLQSSFEAFRTHKGNMEMGGILFQLTFVNEDTGLRVESPAFVNKEYSDNRMVFNRKILQKKYDGSEDVEVDIFDELVDKEGNLTVEVHCQEAGQLLGMARSDLFIRTPDRPFYVGYSKAVFGIWMPMVLVIMLGVTISCFVKGPVAILTTLTVVLVGFMSKEYMNEILSGKMEASGAIEAWYRLITHMNSQTELPPGPVKGIIGVVDAGIINFLWLCQQVIPNFGIFSNMREYVIKGFDISWSAALLPGIVTTAAYILPCLIVSFYSLKLRELEAK